ncbi:hypothetical protein BUALT_Bualt02G0223100 [Buddleja alternifolia]|uniref:Protein PALE CRESS, chloroplastic n=1 Tax=Buddleja alternifolia TaxID=168488 RepID=A0AAV6Y3K7_9LAMI|nr:hypothetical protein BUALT_Bualt02G0223100 [Buddleja alternifolia]
MEAKSLYLLTCAALPPSANSSCLSGFHKTYPIPPSFRTLRSCKKIEEQDYLYGLPKEYYDDEWQAKQREKTKEFHKRRQEEDEEEERKVDEYREIGLRLKDYPEEELRKVKKLVSSFIRSAEEVEEPPAFAHPHLVSTFEIFYNLVANSFLPKRRILQSMELMFFFVYKHKIEEAAEKGELNELVLMVIWNRLDLARRDDEKDAIRSLDLLYRRVETEILKREASPAMRLLNDLLNMHDGFDDDGWIKSCKKHMVETFPREDPFSILVPAGFDIDKHQGPMRPAMDADDVLLRVDFVREVNALLQEVRSEQNEALNTKALDPESVASRLKQQEKQRAIRQVEALLDLAINLTW